MENSDKTKSKVKILLVEDSPAIQKLLCHFLNRTPYEVDIAENGEEAIDKFRLGNYGLVLMDMQMPVMNGIESCMAMRGLERETGKEPVPIVAITATEISGDDSSLDDAGFDGYISKPVKMHDFLNSVENHIRLR